MGRKGLGRGFESLIPTDLLDEAFDPTARQDEQLSELRQLALAQIFADPDQPRRVFEETALEELAESIRQHGVLQPIIVTPVGDKFQIVAGERRFRASQLAKLSTIPALVRALDDQHKLEVSLIENLQRRDLNPIETATAYVKLRDQFNLTYEQIGKRVGNKSISSISNMVRLLRLPPPVRQAIADGQLSEGHVRPLVGQADEFIETLVARIIAEEWSVRKVEQYMVNTKQELRARVPSSRDVEQRHEQKITSLRERLNTEVNIRVNGRGGGQIIIRFKDGDELDRLQGLLGE